MFFHYKILVLLILIHLKIVLFGQIKYEMNKIINQFGLIIAITLMFGITRDVIAETHNNSSGSAETYNNSVAYKPKDSVKEKE